MYIYMYIYMYVCIYIYLCMYVYIYTHIYMLYMLGTRHSQKSLFVVALYGR